jgi:hypothetical protein
MDAIRRQIKAGLAAQMRKTSPGMRGFAGCRVLSWSSAS